MNGKSVGRPNIIFIMLDTVRADMLNVYGGDVRLSNIDRIARRGVVYENAISPGTYTVPSHVSLFLGRRVRDIKTLRHDMLSNYNNNIDPFLERSKYIKTGEVTLAKKLRYLGYKTALFSNNPFVTATTGIGEGFSYIENVFMKDKIENNTASVRMSLFIVANRVLRNNLIRLAYLITNAMPRETLDNTYLRLRIKLNKHFAKEYGFYNLDKGAAKTNRLVGTYFDYVPPEDNFVFINYMEGHEGYPTNLFSRNYVEQEKWLYLSGIQGSDSVDIIKRAYAKRLAYLDKKVGQLLDILREKGVLDNAIVVIASDHGQAFMEHGVMYHNMFPYNQLVKAPLISAKFVDGKQVKTTERVSNVVSLTALHESIMRIGRGEIDELNGSLRRDNFVFSDHVGITEVWDTYLLRLLKDRSKYVKSIYRAKLLHNTHATAIFHGNYKLIHYYGRRNGLKDALYRIDDAEEADNLLEEKRGRALEMLHAGSS